jgi:hypothetical protein
VENRLESQHGDEMRRPDSRSGNQAGSYEPDIARISESSLCAAEHAEGREGRKQAKQARQKDEPQVVLFKHAAYDVKHGGHVRRGA